MATTDDQFVTAEGLAKSLGTVSGGFSPEQIGILNNGDTLPIDLTEYTAILVFAYVSAAGFKSVGSSHIVPTEQLSLLGQMSQIDLVVYGASPSSTEIVKLGRFKNTSKTSSTLSSGVTSLYVYGLK